MLTIRLNNSLLNYHKTIENISKAMTLKLDNYPISQVLLIKVITNFKCYYPKIPGTKQYPHSVTNPFPKRSL